MRAPESTRTKIGFLAGATVFTLALHYGWLIEPIFGEVHWVHAIHGRMCYIPIVVAAAWFGLRGGLIMAGTISVLVLPVVLGAIGNPHDFANEMAEVVFYFAIAILIGLLVEREFAARRKQQETQLQVERAHKLSLVGQIAAGVAHEIKNPLASIKGAADILTNNATSAAEREEFKEILQNEIKRIDATVAEFLDFARAKETRFEPLDWAQNVAATLRQIEAHAKQEGLSIEAEFAPDVRVSGDPEQLHQVTLNLLLNAIQGSPGGGAIRVRLGRASAREAALTISDFGVGITREDLEHVFEPFYTTRASGTGLGLAVVKDIVESHAGRVDIASERGGGTTVTVTLPLRLKGGADENPPR